ncbi:DNA repair exonuclease SbcCD nuclease subunit [Kineococcus radiotolerans]|uniref:DNA repair exonuclease SbcCD nuclease subunit n=1 Tax=Kineococcus radiotolerans TaxID=131568 RepID=A0A7W4XYN2_KINRA|nr:metallophosphoesterase [Kineococcus radiotolerans]MBB2903228.1 DNA repair exonuclease SbcCD nuclease subunit [Kineococcus radiotolerans]
MSEPVYEVGFVADAHLGYAARCGSHPASGLNHRVRDGYLSYRAVVRDMIAKEVDLVIDGGDTFHQSHPSIGAIVWARRQMEALAAAGIPVIGNTGNHDASADRSKSPATAAINDPARGIDYVTEPYRVFEPLEGLAVHMISHYGLAQSERLLPEPIDGVVNLLSAHGAAMLPGHEVFRSVDSPGEVPIGLDILADDRFAFKALGHYHGMGEILPSVWYAGSLVRRGFADPAGGRGWLLCKVFADGQVVVEPQYIDQRPQFDLPRIDAKGKTGAQVEEEIRANLETVDVANAIIRQVVVNCSTSTRRGIDQPALAKLMESALMWMPDFVRPQAFDQTLDRISDQLIDPVTGLVVDSVGDGVTEAVPGAAAAVVAARTADSVAASLTSAGSADLPTVYGSWVEDYASAVGLAQEMKPTVITEGIRHLKAASQFVETGDFAIPDARARRSEQEQTAAEQAQRLRAAARRSPSQAVAGADVRGTSPDTSPDTNSGAGADPAPGVPTDAGAGEGLF